ncbi:hypothetical protein [Armatimonas sp.]|uniref:hypothetical protein n=1 Tax=Armatimonas sp. TaxID=1872638 RepID=UPI003750E829
MKPDIDALLTQGQLVQEVDDARTATDRFKLLAFLRTQLDSDVISVASFDNQKDTAESGRRSNKPRYDAAVDTLTERLRDGFRHIEAIPDFELSAADKQAALIAYGFERGILGDLKNTARVIQLGHKALAQTPQIAPPNAHFPESVITRIQEQLAIIAEAAPQATTSPRQAATKQRNAAQRGGKEPQHHAPADSLLLRLHHPRCRQDPRAGKDRLPAPPHQRPAPAQKRDHSVAPLSCNKPVPDYRLPRPGTGFASVNLSVS